MVRKGNDMKLITSSELSMILSIARSTGGDFAELFFEDREDTVLKDLSGSMNGGATLHIAGVGLYVLKGTSSVYVYGNDTSFEGLKRLAEAAADMIGEQVQGNAPQEIVFSRQQLQPIHHMELDPRQISTRKKVEVVKEMYHSAITAGPAIRSMNVEFYDYVQHLTILNSEELWAEDERCAQRVRLSGVVGWKDQSYAGFSDFNRPSGFEAFESGEHAAFAKEAVLKMEERLQIQPMAACTLPVVFEAGPCGTFWHEACGHNLESASFTSSCFAGMEGKQIASSKVTLIDDGSIPGLSGSETMDDEGHPTQKNILIENGVMKGWLCDRKGGRITGQGSTGSGRRQNYTYAPTSRMHNTYLAAGEDDDDEMISSLEEGLLVTAMGGGQSGRNFSVAVTEGFHIKNGEICERVGGMTLSGTTAEIIQRIDRVGKKIEVDRHAGFCGASSGLVQVTSFEPRFRIREMRVGG